MEYVPSRILNNTDPVDKVIIDAVKELSCWLELEVMNNPGDSSHQSVSVNDSIRYS